MLYNFRTEDMKWVPYEPKAKMLALDHIYPEGIPIPDYFFGKNIVHLPTVKCHIYTHHHRRDEERLWRAAEQAPPLHAHLDPRDAGGPAGHPEGDPPRPVRRHGRHHRRQRAAARALMKPVIKNVILASADQVAIDAVAAKLMGFDPLSINYIRLAHERGLGVGDAREIELVGDDISGENWGFKVGQHPHVPGLAGLVRADESLPEAAPAYPAGRRADLHRRVGAGLHVLAAEVQACRRNLARRNRLGAVIPAVSTRKVAWCEQTPPSASAPSHSRDGTRYGIRTTQYLIFAQN